MANTCKVWDYITNTQGQLLEGVEVYVTLAAEDSAYASGLPAFVVPEARMVQTNVSGYFEIDLIPSSGLVNFSRYRFMIPRLYYSKLVAVPETSGVRLQDM